MKKLKKSKAEVPGSVMSENQHTEWKESWRDEYMKHVCAFANAQGGSLFIGIRDDGTVIGVRDGEKLLEEIPNKAVQLLGITVGVEVQSHADKNVIAINVAPSPVPVSFHGRFYIRSGSTVQELRSHELREFILRKDNITWDELPVLKATLADVDMETISRFARKAALANRLIYDAEKDEPAAILRKMGLMNDEGELTRAAILLFGRSPKKHIRSATAKIGRFGMTPADLVSHDIIEGNL